MDTLRLNYITLLLGLVSPVFFIPVSAEEVLETIIVKATKTESDVQDIGISVLTFDEQALRELQINDQAALAEQMPGIQHYTSANLPSYTIRGVGMSEFAASFDAPVAVHIDEVFFSKPFMLSMGLFDMQRVEALKGPQGTLFGRNTTGGAVNYYTRKPTEELEAGLELTYGNFERFRSQGFISGPIAANLLGRFSFSSAIAGGGPYDNIRFGEEVGKWDKQEFRGQLAWEQDKLRIDAGITGGYDKSDLTPYKNTLPAAASVFPPTDPADTFTINQDQFPTADNEALGGNLNVQYDFDNFTFTSITALNHFTRDQREDSDASSTNTITVKFYAEIDLFTQELRLTGNITDQWRYVAGFFYENEDMVERNSAAFVPGGVPLPGRIAADWTQETESFAWFFHNEFDFTDTLTVIAGLRFSHDEIDVDGITFVGAGDADDGVPVPVVALVDALNGERTDKDVSYKMGLDWKAAENLLVYTNVSTGYRTGGFAFPFGGVITSFDPEEMTTFELGFKSRLLDETLQLNTAAYRNHLDNSQQNVDIAGSVVPVTLNAGDMVTTGIETDVWWKPGKEWDIKAGLAYMDSEFERSALTVGGLPVLGKRPINTPEWSLSGLVRYERPIGNNLKLVLLTDASWTDERFLEITNLPAGLADSYYLLNARAAIGSADGQWEIAAWGKNITDQEYLSYINDITPFFILEINGEPATYGVTATYNF